MHVPNGVGRIIWTPSIVGKWCRHKDNDDVNNNNNNYNDGGKRKKFLFFGFMTDDPGNYSISGKLQPPG